MDMTHNEARDLLQDADAMPAHAVIDQLLSTLDALEAGLIMRCESAETPVDLTIAYALGQEAHHARRRGDGSLAVLLSARQEYYFEEERLDKGY